MRPLPLSVVGGFLGAGKTTLINRVLTANHGVRIAVLVNDFGAINIDASLLASADEDTIELTNGCICCAMSGDLFFTIGDILDRPIRPDHLIVEASGIADPAKIAAVALAEKDLRYAGILTVVDGLNCGDQLADDAIADQVKAQITCADLVAVSKAPKDDETLGELLKSFGVHRRISTDDWDAIQAFLLDNAIPGKPVSRTKQGHLKFVQWSSKAPDPMDRADLERRLDCVPEGVLRVKGLLPSMDGGVWEVHLVGRHRDISKHASAEAIGIVAIGLRDLTSKEEIEKWWSSTTNSSK